MNAPHDKQPTVYLRIGPSAITLDKTGEIIETVDFDEHGRPVWASGGICDDRGAGSVEGFQALNRAIVAAEKNAQLSGFEIERI